MAAEEIEGGAGRHVLEGHAVEREVATADDGGMSGGGQADEDGADGFVFRAAAGSGHAGGGEGELRTGNASRAFGHGGGNGFADGTVGGEKIGGNAESGFFRLVGVGDIAGEENVRGAGDIGEASGQRSAGAGFGGGEGEVIFAQEVEDGGLKRCTVGVDPRADGGADGAVNFIEQGQWTDETEIDFGGTGAVADFDVAAFFELLADAFFDLTFADAGEAVDAAFAEGRGWKDGAQFGQNVIGDHRTQLAGRAGQKKKMTRAARTENGGREVKAGRGAVRVGQHFGAGGDHGLAGDAAGHGESAAGEAFADGGENFFVGQKR